MNSSFVSDKSKIEPESAFDKSIRLKNVLESLSKVKLLQQTKLENQQAGNKVLF